MYKGIITLQGGLGNQLFQYALVRSLSQVNLKLYFDLSFLAKNNRTTNTFTSRNYELEIFENLKAQPLPKIYQTFINSPSWIYILLSRFLLGKLSYLKYNSLKYEPISVNGSFYLEGYFQSEKYFKHIRSELLQELAFPFHNCGLDEIIADIKSKTHSVALHVRRGDYLKPSVQNVHGILTTEYYKEAIDFILSAVTNPYFFIFSDDEIWCENTFRDWGINYFIVTGNSGNNAWKDMYLMSICKHHIIANSSFSWWGAWLSNCKNTIKIAPKQWYNPSNGPFPIEDIVPDNWILF